MSGPTVICSRGPIRADSAPDRAEKTSMTSVKREQRHAGLERACSP